MSDEELQNSANEQVSDANLANKVVESDEAQQEKPVEPEKMLPQSQVNKIAAREARIAADKTRQEMVAQFEKERMANQRNDSGSSDQPTSSQPSDYKIQQMIQEQAVLLAHRQTAQRIGAEYKQKIDVEMRSDPEFAELYDALNIEQHPDLILLTNGVDNTAAVIKDFANNPAKFANVLMLARSGSPRLAEMEIAKLSKSIKVNEAAKKQPSVPTPSSQLKPSNISPDSGKLEIADFKRRYRG